MTASRKGFVQSLLILTKSHWSHPTSQCQKLMVKKNIPAKVVEADQ
jgi:hypothetical protein